MAYSQGNPALALDYNTIRTTVANIYGVGSGTRGYNQSAISFPAVAVGTPIEGSDWINMRNAIAVCQQHQNISAALIPPVADFQAGIDLVRAHDGVTDPDDFPQMAANIDASRLTAPAASLTPTLNIQTQSSTATWNVQATTATRFNFGSEDAARAFFNSGGQLRARFSRSGGSSTPQNTSWTNLLNGLGTVRMNYTNTTRTGALGAGSSIGYYDLTGSYQTIATAIVGSGTYSANRVNVRARRVSFSGANGGNGSQVDIQVQMLDNKTGSFDTVNGTLTVRWDVIRATTFLTIPTPATSVIQALAPT